LARRASTDNNGVAASEQVDRLKESLQLSTTAEKLELQREFQRLEKELYAKVQAQRAELMAESARLRFLVGCNS